MEPALLRRPRYPDRVGRHLVLSRHADRAAPLVKLFASVLKREHDKYFLVTPVEKIGIIVEDAPFLAVEMQPENTPTGPRLHFRTNVDDWVTCDADHGLRFEPEISSGG